jgi:hypothetical protein
MESGIRYDTVTGTPQGGIISPILANVYLHYVVDLWFEKVIRKQCRGAAYMVRYADDHIFCFQHENEAKAFYEEFPKRLGKFGLELSPEKSKIIAFGRKASMNDDDNDGKPETFDFLGFTHYCSKSLKGKFRVKRKTSNNKYRASLLRCKLWIQKNRHQPKEELMKSLGLKLQGYYRYYGITDNSIMLRKFQEEVKRHLFKNLNRRSQRRSYTWDKFQLFLKKYPLPKPKIHVNIFDLRTELGYIM